MRTVVVTAIGSFSADIVIKTCKKMGIRVVGCDIYPKEWIADSQNVDNFYQVPLAVDQEAYRKALMEICRREKAWGLLPLTDVEIDVLTGFREEFCREGITLCISGEECISLCRDKMKFYQFMKKNNMGNPILTKNLLEAEPDGIKYPLVCKPRDGRSSQGLRFVGSPQELENLKRLEGAERYIVQPKIEGRVVTVDVVRDPESGESAAVCRRELLRTLNGAGTSGAERYIVQPKIEGRVVTVDVVRDPESGESAAVCRRELLRTLNGAGTSIQVFRDPKLEETCKEAAKRLGVKGCVNMEFLEEGEGSCRILECNPRFSGGVEFSCLAGCGCVEGHLRIFMGQGLDQMPKNIEPMFIARKYEEYITKRG